MHGNTCGVVIPLVKIWSRHQPKIIGLVKASGVGLIRRSRVRLPPGLPFLQEEVLNRREPEIQERRLITEIASRVCGLAEINFVDFVSVLISKLLELSPLFNDPSLRLNGVHITTRREHDYELSLCYRSLPTQNIVGYSPILNSYL